MNGGIRESDWKYLNRLKPELLERACARINREAQLKLENKKKQDQHQLYLALYKHYDQKDDVIAECFNDYRRSTARNKILRLLYHGIMTEAEFEGFNGEMKETVRAIRDTNTHY